MANKKDPENKDQKVVVISQASADVKWTLDLCERFTDFDTHILCVSSKYNYKFYKSLEGLEAEVSFVGGQFNLNNPLDIIRSRKWLQKIVHKKFDFKTKYTVFFHSNSYDWKTFGIVKYLSNKKNRVYYIPHDEASSILTEKSTSIKGFVKKIIYYLISKSKVEIRNVGENNIPQLNVDEYPIKKLNHFEINGDYKKYKYKTRKISKSKIILADTDPNKVGVIDGYESTMGKILKSTLKNEYKIVIKPHPRLGCSSIAKRSSNLVIPKYIPMEMIDTSDVCAIMGIKSTGLGHVSKICKSTKVISLIDMFNFTSVSEKTYFKERIVSDSDGSVYFPNCLSEFCDIIRC